MNSRWIAKCLIWSIAFAWTTVTSAATLDHGHQVLLQKGFQVQAYVGGGQSSPLTNSRWAQSNFTSPVFVGSANLPSGTNFGRMTTNLPSVWPVLQPGEDVSKAVNLQWRDEQRLDATNIAEAQSVFASWKSSYPSAMVYTNQSGTQESTDTLGHYIDTAHPDMLSFDTYPFNGSLTGGSPKNWYQDLQKYRRLSLGWRDGNTTAPSGPTMPYSVFLQTYTNGSVNNHVISESEVRLNQFGAWTFGAKMANAFFYVDGPAFVDGSNLDSVLFDGADDALPTVTFHQVAETNRQSRNLGPALLPLGSTDVLMVMGQHKYNKLWPWDPNSVTNDTPSGVSTWTSSTVPYITSVSATNLGGKNDGLPGDVLIGKFKPLDASFTNAGHANDTYFMVTNGLTDANGSAEQCRQQVHLNFDFGSSGITSLQRLNRETGQVEVVNLTHVSNSQYRLDLMLDGGTGDLFKYNNGGTFMVPEPSPLTMLMAAGAVAGIARLWRKRKQATVIEVLE
jgi:hypothetical protein